MYISTVVRTHRGYLKTFTINETVTFDTAARSIAKCDKGQILIWKLGTCEPLSQLGQGLSRRRQAVVPPLACVALNRFLHHVISGISYPNQDSGSRVQDPDP